MAFEEAECEAMIAEAEKAKVKLVIAYRLHIERGNLQAIQVVNSGKIGEPRIFTSSFSQQVRSGNSRVKKDIGGGPLYDLGVYCINAARYLFRAEPEQVFAWHSGGDGDRFREVPATTTAMLQFPGDRVASFTCSFGAADRSVFEVIGTKGVLRMDPAYEMVEALKSEISINGKTTKQVFRRRDQFAAELVYFSGCVLNHQDPEPSGREGLADVRIIQALLQSAETNRPVTIRTTEVSHRPTMTQEIARTAVTRPPQMVKASAPGKENCRARLCCRTASQTLHRPEFIPEVQEVQGDCICRTIKQKSALINPASAFPPREKNIAVNSAKTRARAKPRLLVIVVIRLARTEAAGRKVQGNSRAGPIAELALSLSGPTGEQARRNPG